MSDNNNNEHNQPPESELLRIRREKLLHLRSVGLDPYAQTTYDKSHSSASVLSNFEALEGQTVSVAGSMMSKRVMGKASFSHIQDMEGKIQLYVRKDVIGEDP